MERRFYTAMALALAAVVFVGFAPSFYLRNLSAAPRPLTPLLIAHGIAFSLWIGLLLTQSALISARRVDLHRKLGIVGVVLASAMIVLGAATALTLALRLEVSRGPVAAGRAGLALLDLPIFAALVTAAILLRRRPQIHKRLILLATIALIGAAVNRLPLPMALAGKTSRFLLADLFCLALILWDLVSTRRFHPATLAGTGAILLDQIAQASLSQSEVWPRIVAGLIHL